MFSAIGWLVIAIGGGVAAWALFRDRARGRKRCPRCWYDMSGVPGLKCPECGREALSERGLRRTRRRWRRAAAGAAIASLAYGVFVVPDVAERGLRAAIPGVVLVCWPLDLTEWIDPASPSVQAGGAPGVIREELGLRIEEHRLADWQFAILLARIRAACHARDEYGITDAQRETLDKVRAAPGLTASDEWPLEVLQARLALLGLTLNIDSRLAPGPGPFEAEYLAESLDQFAWSMGSDWVPEKDGIRLIARETWGKQHRATTRVVAYGVGDLAPVRVRWIPPAGIAGTPTANAPAVRYVDSEQLEKFGWDTLEFVSPDAWLENGGRVAVMHTLGESFIVRATPQVHVALERWLRTLRGALRVSPGAAAGEPEGSRPFIRAYNVEDLLERGSDPSPEVVDLEMRASAFALMDSLTGEVGLLQWRDTGGSEAHCRYIRPLLIVWASPEVHAGVEAFLAARRAGSDGL